MTVSHQELVSPNCLRQKSANTKKWQWRRINYCLWSGIVLLILAYLAVANNLAIQTFALRDYKKQLAKLEQEQVDLQTEVARLNSYSYLQQQVQHLGMVPVSRLSYAVSANDLMAKK